MTKRKNGANQKTGLKYSASLDEVARELGLSAERIRQIESQALAKVRRELRKRGLRLEDLVPD